MTTTYSLDADVANADPHAVDMLPTADAGTYDRLRVAAKAEIGRRLLRREPSVSPSTLGDTSELTQAEVRFVLHYLYRDASVRAGDDLLWVKSEYWKKEAESEINGVQLTVSGEDVSSAQGGSVPVWRS